MNNLLLAGYALVVLDVAIWRFKLPESDIVRLFVRLFVFAALSAVLFTANLSPFSKPDPGPLFSLQLAGQVLEVIWWLNGARLLTLTLDALLLPKAWRKQRLFQDIFGAVVFLAAIVAALAFVFNLPVRGLVATSGALAIVLGLAIQSTLSDVFAGIVINTTEPYEVGNWVSIDGTEGKVIEMNWRATHLLTGQGNVVVVPNALAAKSKITNSNRPPSLHGISVVVEVSPEERPGAVVAALDNALVASRSILVAPEPYVQVKKTGVNFILYEVTAYVDDMAKKTQATNELYDLAHRHLTAAGIDLRPIGAATPGPQAGDKNQIRLRRVELFATLDDEEIKKLATHLTSQKYEIGQVLATPDTVPDSLTIIDTGVLSVIIEEQSGHVEAGRLGPGDVIGEGGLLAGMPANVRVVTLTKTTVSSLRKEDLTPILKANPEVAKSMCRLLSTRQEILGKLSVDIPAQPAQDQSVFQWLLDRIRDLHSLTS
jgi:small-conductance mechanosensitive channel